MQKIGIRYIPNKQKKQKGIHRATYNILKPKVFHPLIEKLRKRTREIHGTSAQLFRDLRIALLKAVSKPTKLLTKSFMKIAIEQR